jgi:hypothetical protein
MMISEGSGRSVTYPDLSSDTRGHTQESNDHAMPVKAAPSRRASGKALIYLCSNFLIAVIGREGGKEKQISPDSWTNKQTRSE